MRIAPMEPVKCLDQRRQAVPGLERTHEAYRECVWRAGAGRRQPDGEAVWIYAVGYYVHAPSCAGIALQIGRDLVGHGAKHQSAPEDSLGNLIRPAPIDEAAVLGLFLDQRCVYFQQAW